MKIDGTTEAVTIALDFIASHEGFSSKAYPDPPGQTAKYSIGYGHQITDGDGLSLSSEIPESVGYTLLSQDVQSRVDCVFATIKQEMTPKQAAALISFCYNVGCAAFQQSTMVKLINNGNFDAAAEEFGRWIYAGGDVNDGLVSRRADEQTLFEG